MDWRELKKRTGIYFPLDEAEDRINVDKAAFAKADLDQIESLVPGDCKQRARFCQFLTERLGYDRLSRFLDMFPNLSRLRFYNCWYEDPSLYKAFENRPIESLELSLFANDTVCFDSLSKLTSLTELHLPNLNTAAEFGKIISNLKALTIHAPDLTMDQCVRFKELVSLDIFSDCIEPETDYPRLADLPGLRRLTMPVYGNNFKYIPNLPMLEEFRFRSTPCCKEPFLAYAGESIQYAEGDFAEFPYLGSLKKLELNGRMLLDSLKQVLAKTPNIRDLSVANNELVKNDDLLFITQLRQLEKCYFYRTKVKGSTMKKLAHELPNCEFEL